MNDDEYGKGLDQIGATLDEQTDVVLAALREDPSNWDVIHSAKAKIHAAHAQLEDLIKRWVSTSS